MERVTLGGPLQISCWIEQMRWVWEEKESLTLYYKLTVLVHTVNTWNHTLFFSYCLYHIAMFNAVTYKINQNFSKQQEDAEPYVPITGTPSIPLSAMLLQNH